MARSIYIHVPFCEHICPYCDFARTLKNEKLVESWLDVITKEMEETIAPDTRFDTVYIGGGTPSVLSALQFERLVSKVKEHLTEKTEFTIECNPESLTDEKLETYVQNGVNRLSLGVQSFHEKTIRKLGRHHTPPMIEKTIRMIREHGIQNISIDLMFAIPGQTMEEVEEDLQMFYALGLDHLSIYSLIFEENSAFTRSGLQPVDEDLEADEYELIVKSLKEHGYEHYEISSFTRDKKYSRHNLAYWTDQDFIGIGCGASGRENGQRYTNTKSVARYIRHGACPKKEETDAPFEALMMGLRTMFGVDLNAFKTKYGIDLAETAAGIIPRYRDDLEICDGHLVCTETGMEKLNSILVDFLELFE